MPWMLALLCALASALAACASPTPELVLSAPDRVAFETQAYPVLLRDCGFHACHGSSERFFQVFGPGHGRILSTTQPLDEVQPLEVEYSYQRARSMLDSENLDQSPLLLKPLSPAAGGVGHQGVDSLGRDVYVSTTEPGYAALAAWIMTAVPPPPTPATP
jgi:hypothetical protein